jgi:hypothetical protein
MTSGAFTAAHLELIPRLELLTGRKIVTASTSIGTGENSIPNRLRRGEVVDVVSESGRYLTTELYQRLGIADQVMGKSRLIGKGVRVGAVVARGEAEIGSVGPAT